MVNPLGSLSMKSEKANMAGLKESQPSLSQGYLTTLKSPNKSQALFHRVRTLEKMISRFGRQKEGAYGVRFIFRTCVL